METQSVITQRAPSIMPPQQTANANAIRYGYNPLAIISLVGPTGIEMDVQPGHSPFRTRLPEKELIPFVTYEVNEVDPELAEKVGDTVLYPGQAPVKKRLKSALECVNDVIYGYQQYGFRHLTPMVGMDEDSANHIFQTIQPFRYNLVDMAYELGPGASERIAATEPYIPVWGKVEWNEPLKPLPTHLKPIAEQVRPIMAAGAAQAATKASKFVTASVQAIEQYYTTGYGKIQADPRDHKFFAEMAVEIPSVFSRTPNRTTPEAESGYIKMIADAIGGRKGSDPEKDALIEEMRAKLDEQEKRINALAAMKSGIPEKISIGDPVTVDGQTATVTAKPFGKITVGFEDGTTRTVDKTQING